MFWKDASLGRIDKLYNLVTREAYLSSIAKSAICELQIHREPVLLATRLQSGPTELL